MNKQIMYGVLGVIVGGLSVWLLATVAPATTSVKTNDQVNSDTLDMHFIEQMIPHHEDAITMAKLAQSKAQTPQLKQMAKNIIDSQGKEITQMQNWYKEWFGEDLPTGEEVMQPHGMGKNSSMHMGMSGDESDITRLTESKNFDITFVEQMIPHHQMAIMMANMLKNGTQRQEMKDLADNIITAQSQEIEEMRKWLAAWTSK